MLSGTRDQKATHKSSEAIKQESKEAKEAEGDMPDKKQWNCSQVADFLAELEVLLKRHGLDAEGVGDALADHIESCNTCDQAAKRLGEVLNLS